MPERSDLKTCDLTPKHRRMRKTEENPEHYDIQSKGCLVYTILVTILISLGLIALCSCGEQSQNKQKCKCFLNVRNGSGWSAGGSVVECDSFQMQGTRKAFVWVDGCKMNIEAEDVIYPHIR